MCFMVLEIWQFGFGKILEQFINSIKIVCTSPVCRDELHAVEDNNSKCPWHIDRR